MYVKDGTAGGTNHQTNENISLCNIMRVSSTILSLTMIVMVGRGAVTAFVAHPQTTTAVLSSRTSTTTSLPAYQVFEGVAPAIQSYVNIWTPLFQSAKESGLAPDFLIKYGHGAAMSSVLLSMGLIGSWMGWQIRNGNGETVNALTLGETMREAHPKIMAGAFFFFLLGGQGGLVLLDTQGKSILESPHAVTALVGITLLAIQAALPFVAFDKSFGRSAHAYLGSGTIVALFAHMATGINLGLSL